MRLFYKSLKSISLKYSKLGNKLRIALVPGSLQPFMVNRKMEGPGGGIQIFEGVGVKEETGEK